VQATAIAQCYKGGGWRLCLACSKKVTMRFSAENGGFRQWQRSAASRMHRPCNPARTL